MARDVGSLGQRPYVLSTMNWYRLMPTQLSIKMARLKLSIKFYIIFPEQLVRWPLSFRVFQGGSSTLDIILVWRELVRSDICGASALGWA